MSTDERQFLAWFTSLPAPAAALIERGLISANDPLLIVLIRHVTDCPKQRGEITLPDEGDDAALVVA